jgi:beta-glucanase (GH16 family)
MLHFPLARPRARFDSSPTAALHELPRRCPLWLPPLLSALLLACGDDASRVEGSTGVPEHDAAVAPGDAGLDARVASQTGGEDARLQDDPTPIQVTDSGASGLADAGGTSDPSGARPGYRLVFRDEFDGKAGSLPDQTKWVFETGGGGFGNNELEYYTARPENASLDGQGMLVITARAESYMGSKYTSARLKTAGKLEQTYGRYEARLRIPKGQGIWPAFWMLGANIGPTPWPDCGEIDIMENVGKEPALVHGTLHGPGYSGGNGIGQSAELPGRAAFADDFHEFAVEWEANVVRWYVDGALYQTRTPSDLPSGAKWVFDHPFFVLLNLAVGGQWPGSPDKTTTYPQALTVDYVRVYTKQ